MNSSTLQGLENHRFKFRYFEGFQCCAQTPMVLNDIFKSVTCPRKMKNSRDKDVPLEINTTLETFIRWEESVFNEVQLIVVFEEQFDALQVPNRGSNSLGVKGKSQN